MAVTIKGSVGKGGKNVAADVKAIQTALKKLYPGAGITVNGKVDTKTQKSIETFQKAFMAKPDGRIDPGGRSLSEINKAMDKVTPITSGTTAAPAAPTTPVAPVTSNLDWTGDSSKWTQEKKLQSMNTDFAAKVRKVLAALEKQGFQPTIFYGWRSTKVQLQLFNAGNSKVKFSFHNATDPNGKPNAFAADIIDKRYAWNPEAEKKGYWDALGEACRANGLFWGGDWQGFKDVAHIQFYPNEMLAEIKKASGA